MLRTGLPNPLCESLRSCILAVRQGAHHISSLALQVKDSLLLELQQKAEETELLQMELQMLETERVRLSLVEEKLMDVLQLLQQLRDLVSRGPLSPVNTARG